MFFLFFRALNHEISKASTSRELYTGRPFKMIKRPIFLLVFNAMYTSRTKLSMG